MLVSEWFAPPSSNSLAEKWGASEEEKREGERAKDEWAHCFSSPFRADHRPGVFSGYTSSFLSFPSSFSLSLSPRKNLSLNLLSLHMAHPWIFPPFFLIIGFTSSVQSHTVVGIRSLPSVHLLSLQTPSPHFSHTHPCFFSFVRHRIRIYKSQLTTPHSPQNFLPSYSKLLFNFFFFFLWCAMFEAKRKAKEKLKIQNTHKQWGQTKESERKEIGTGLVGFSQGERGCQFRRNLWCLL